MYFVEVPVPSLIVIEGAPKVYKAHGDSGRPIYRRFCDNCGSPLWVEVDSVPGMAFVNGPIFNVDRSVGLEIWYKNAYRECITNQSLSTRLSAGCKPGSGPMRRKTRSLNLRDNRRFSTVSA